MYSIEEYDEYKTKVLKYVLYKKRTKSEVRKKFLNVIDEEILSDVINELEENGYINDNDYIKRIVNDFEALNNLSIKEVKYKLLSKGIESSMVEIFVSDNYDELLEYERESAKKIFIKKSNTMDELQIKQFLLKKGYRFEIIEDVINELGEGC